MKGNDYLNRIRNVVNDSIERLMNDKTIDIESMCHLIRASASREGSRRNRTQERLIRCIEEKCSDPSFEDVISSRTIQNVTRSLFQMNYAVPKLSEKMLIYVNENKNHVSGDTAARLLFYLFSVGYEPDRKINCDDIEDKKNESSKILNAPFFDFENFSQIIHRDFDLMPAWLIIETCLALGFYQALPLDLINRVFNLEFITRVERETLNNRDKIHYPKNILNMMMQLNRIVCLDYPEAAIPWFQQNFIEANTTLPCKDSISYKIIMTIIRILSMMNLIFDYILFLSVDIDRNPYFNDIYNLLLKLVGGDKNMIRLNHITPYGYRVIKIIILCIFKIRLML